MPLKFAANISMLFQELPTIAARFNAAHAAGFRYVECTFPYAEDPDELGKARREAGLEHILINTWPGDKGEMGLAALPDRVDDFKKELEKAIKYANSLECKRMHVMAGCKANYDVKEMEKTFIENLKYTADRLKKEGILCLIEPLNTRITAPNYFLDNIHTAVNYIKKINHPNLKLQFDVYHTQIIAGDLTANLKKYLPFTGHVQIAQVPDRDEPDLGGEINYKYIFNPLPHSDPMTPHKDVYHTQIIAGDLTANLKKYLPFTGHVQIAQVPNRDEPDLGGEINYKYIFKVLEDFGYDGYIGCEYKPRGSTEEGLKWIKELGITL